MHDISPSDSELEVKVEKYVKKVEEEVKEVEKVEKAQEMEMVMGVFPSLKSCVD